MIGHPRRFFDFTVNKKDRSVDRSFSLNFNILWHYCFLVQQAFPSAGFVQEDPEVALSAEQHAFFFFFFLSSFFTSVGLPFTDAYAVVATDPTNAVRAKARITFFMRLRFYDRKLRRLS